MLSQFQALPGAPFSKVLVVTGSKKLSFVCRVCIRDCVQSFT